MSLIPILLSILISTAGQSRQPELEPNELGSLFDMKIIEKIGGLGLDGKRRAGHFYSSSHPVSRKRIPDGVIEPCELWMRKILKPQYIPANINSLWHGIRMAPDIDLIVANYVVKQYAITWIDMEGQMALVVHDNSSSVELKDNDDIKSWVKQTHESFLNMPPGWIRYFRVGVRSFHIGSSVLWDGRTAADLQVDVNGASLDPQGWYSTTTYFTDGLTIYLEFVGYDGGKPVKWNGNLQPRKRLPSSG